MYWRFGGNYDKITRACSYDDWTDCTVGLIKYFWFEVVTDVADSFVNEMVLWKVLGVIVFFTSTAYMIYSKIQYMAKITKIEEYLWNVDRKVKDMELKVNVLAYKTQYRIWKVPHTIRYKYDSRNVQWAPLKMDEKKCACIKYPLTSNANFEDKQTMTVGSRTNEQTLSKEFSSDSLDNRDKSTTLTSNSPEQNSKYSSVVKKSDSAGRVDLRTTGNRLDILNKRQPATECTKCRHTDDRLKTIASYTDVALLENGESLKSSQKNRFQEEENLGEKRRCITVALEEFEQKDNITINSTNIHDNNNDKSFVISKNAYMYDNPFFFESDVHNEMEINSSTTFQTCDNEMKNGLAISDNNENNKQDCGCAIARNSPEISEKKKFDEDSKELESHPKNSYIILMNLDTAQQELNSDDSSMVALSQKAVELKKQLLTGIEIKNNDMAEFSDGGKLDEFMIWTNVNNHAQFKVLDMIIEESSENSCKDKTSDTSLSSHFIIGNDFQDVVSVCRVDPPTTTYVTKNSFLENFESGRPVSESDSSCILLENPNLDERSILNNNFSVSNLTDTSSEASMDRLLDRLIENERKCTSARNIANAKSKMEFTRMFLSNLEESQNLSRKSYSSSEIFNSTFVPNIHNWAHESPKLFNNDVKVGEKESNSILDRDTEYFSENEMDLHIKRLHHSKSNNALFKSHANKVSNTNLSNQRLSIGIEAPNAVYHVCQKNSNQDMPSVMKKMTESASFIPIQGCSAKEIVDSRTGKKRKTKSISNLTSLDKTTKPSCIRLKSYYAIPRDSHSQYDSLTLQKRDSSRSFEISRTSSLEPNVKKKFRSNKERINVNTVEKVSRSPSTSSESSLALNTFIELPLTNEPKYQLDSRLDQSRVKFKTHLNCIENAVAIPLRGKLSLKSSIPIWKDRQKMTKNNSLQTHWALESVAIDNLERGENINKINKKLNESEIKTLIIDSKLQDVNEFEHGEMIVDDDTPKMKVSIADIFLTMKKDKIWESPKATDVKVADKVICHVINDNNGSIEVSSNSYTPEMQNVSKAYDLKVGSREAQVLVKPAMLDINAPVAYLPDVTCPIDENSEIFQVPQQLSQDSIVSFLRLIDYDSDA